MRPSLHQPPRGRASSSSIGTTMPGSYDQVSEEQNG